MGGGWEELHVTHHTNSRYFLLIAPELTIVCKMRKCLRENSKKKTIHYCSSLTLCLRIRGASEILHTQHLFLPGIGSSVVSQPLPQPLLCLAFPLSKDIRHSFGLHQPGPLHQHRPSSLQEPAGPRRPPDSAVFLHTLHR